MFKASLPKNKSMCLPDGLGWYPFENSWKSIARGRLDHNLKEFELEFIYNDSFSVDSNVEKALLKGFKDVNIGGNFVDFKETIWNIKVTF